MAHIRYLDRVLLFKGSLHVYLDCLKRCEDLGGIEKGTVGLRYQAEKRGWLVFLILGAQMYILNSHMMGAVNWKIQQVTSMSI
jgi:hypothetical protein